MGFSEADTSADIWRAGLLMADIMLFLCIYYFIRENTAIKSQQIRNRLKQQENDCVVLLSIYILRIYMCLCVALVRPTNLGCPPSVWLLNQMVTSFLAVP